MIFKNPFFLLLVPIFFAFFLIKRKRSGEGSVLFPSDEVISHFKESIKIRMARVLIYLRVASVVLVIIALSRPQIAMESKIKKESIGIMLAIDCSSTMLAEDLMLGSTGLGPLAKRDSESGLNRIDVVREVAADFIRQRTDDWIGIVAFASEAYMVCPLTFDRKWLLQTLERVKVGLISDGTAIGSGILSCLKSLKDLKSKSKAVILLTDGINNAGQTPPLVAAKAARSMGVKIYTIGIVSRGQTPYPSKDMYGHKVYKNVNININEDILKEIANLTGGQFFRTTDIKSLRESYKEINKLEKVEIEETLYAQYRDIFRIFLVLALILLLSEIILGNTVLRTMP
ncbi:MAG: VWA domain-containing protein [Candidatus Omnitrophica bacterium]|nr:VWA domain-containing protein [Candidatus Omnitrophota bacterium]